MSSFAVFLALASIGGLAAASGVDTALLREGLVGRYVRSCDILGAVPGEFYRSFYLPPNSTNNALFLKTLRTMLIFERVDREGRPSALLLTHFTPRSWLAGGKEIRVEKAPTLFGEVSFHIRSRLDQDAIDVVVEPPLRNAPKRLILRLRPPGKRRMDRVVVNGDPLDRFSPEREEIDLSGKAGRLNITMYYAK